MGLTPLRKAYDVGSDPAIGSAFHRAMADLRGTAPVIEIQMWGQPAFLLTRYETVRSAFVDNDRIPAGRSYELSTRPVIGSTFINLDGPAHDQQRRLATPAFRSRAVERFDSDRLRRLVHEVVDRFAERSSAELVTELTTVFPYLAISRKLGLPAADEERLRQWAIGLLGYNFNPGAAREAALQFTSFLQPVIEQRRDSPTDDVLSGLLHSSVDGAQFTDEQVISHVRLLFAVGATTTVHAIGNMLSTVLRRPELWARLRDDPDVRPGVVAESLRFEPPLGALPRFVPERVEIDGYDLPAGSFAVLGIAAANHDPALVAQPEVFDPDREHHEIVTFGFGPHFCPGSHLARNEMAAVLDVLAERLPGIRLASQEGSAPRSAILRAPTALPVTW